MESMIVIASLACLAFCMTHIQSISTSLISGRSGSERTKYLLNSGVLLFLRAALILVAMSSGANAALMRDTVFSFSSVGLMAVTALIVRVALKDKSISLSAQAANYYLPTILVAMAIHLVLVNHVPELDYLSWTVFTGLVSIAVYLFSSADREKVVYTKCLEVTMGNRLPTFVAIPLVIALFTGAFFVGGYAEVSFISGPLLALALAIALYVPELLVAWRLIVNKKVQPVSVVVMDTILSSVLVLVPVIAITAYFLNIDNITSLTDRQFLLLGASTALVYFVHQLKALGQLQFAILLGLTASTIYMMVAI